MLNDLDGEALTRVVMPLVVAQARHPYAETQVYICLCSPIKSGYETPYNSPNTDVLCRSKKRNAMFDKTHEFERIINRHDLMLQPIQFQTHLQPALDDFSASRRSPSTRSLSSCRRQVFAQFPLP